MPKLNHITALLFIFLTVSAHAEVVKLSDYSVESVHLFVSEQLKTLSPKTSLKPNPESPESSLRNLEKFKKQTNIFVSRGGGKGKGGMDGGGGDHLSQEFFKCAHSVLDSLRKKNDLGIDLEALELAIKTTEVVFVDEYLLLDGVRKDAITYPSQHLIKYHTEYWNRTDGVAARSAMVLHELLGIMGVKDIGYGISYKILGAVNIDVIKDPSQIEAVPGSLLHTYDLLVGEMIRLWQSKSNADKKNSIELGESILKMFFGFSEVKKDFFTPDDAIIGIAASFRNVAVYDPNSNSFLRFGDMARITAGQSVSRGGFVYDNIRQRIHIVSDDEYGFSAKRKGGLQYCTVTVGTYFETLKLKQLFSNLLNCGRFYSSFNTDLPFTETKYMSVEQMQEQENRTELMKQMTLQDISGKHNGVDGDGKDCDLTLVKAQNANERFTYEARTTYANISFDLLTGGKEFKKNLFEGATSGMNGCSGSLQLFINDSGRPIYFLYSGFCSQEIIQKKCVF